MSKYTVEQVHEAAKDFAGYSHVHHGVGGELMAIAEEYAALLRERESVKPVAWLDMGKGEAQLVFSKKGQSNRAAKKEAIRLFESIPEGYHPLFLHPLMQSSKAAVTDEIVRIASDARYVAITGDSPAPPNRCEESDAAMRAALEAVAPMLTSARVPDGWQLVPREPTSEMVKAGDDCGFRSYTGTWSITPDACWKAMLAAAGEPNHDA